MRKMKRKKTETRPARWFLLPSDPGRPEIAVLLRRGAEPGKLGEVLLAVYDDGSRVVEPGSAAFDYLAEDADEKKDDFVLVWTKREGSGDLKVGTRRNSEWNKGRHYRPERLIWSRAADVSDYYVLRGATLSGFVASRLSLLEDCVHYDATVASDPDAKIPFDERIEPTLADAKFFALEVLSKRAEGSRVEEEVGVDDPTATLDDDLLGKARAALDAVGL